MLVSSPFDVVVSQVSSLGECPRWNEQSQTLFWTDILGKQLRSYSPETRAQTVINLPEHCGCFAFTHDQKIVAGLRSGLAVLDEKGNVVKTLIANPEPTERSRFNDGRADPLGRFWAGTLDEEKKRGLAHLYQFDGEKLHVMASDLMTSNGLAFSPDGRFVYFSDTPRHIIYRAEFHDEPGQIGEISQWFEMPKGQFGKGRTDGAAVDSEGCYWTALYEGGVVLRLSPRGELLQSYPLPVKCPTMCAFGGRDLRTLFVTSARAGRPEDELAQQPLAGAVFAMQAPVSGLIESRVELTI